MANSLVIQDICYEVDHDSIFTRTKASLHCYIMRYCELTGKRCQVISLTSCGLGTESQETLRLAIENFLNAKFADYQIRHIEFGQLTSGIDNIDVSKVQEPYASMLRDLFNSAKWQMPQNLLE